MIPPNIRKDIPNIDELTLIANKSKPSKEKILSYKIGFFNKQIEDI